MRTSIVGLGAGTTLALLILGAIAQSGEEKVALGKLPKPVIHAVKARFKGAQVTGASQETEDGKSVYEVTIRHDGQKADVTLSPQGEILLIEKEIVAQNLPEMVSKALEERYPKATYRVAEQIIKVEREKEKLAYYEVLLATSERNLLEVQVTVEGKIVNEEKKASDKDK